MCPTVTLEVTPEEGERLALAAAEGHICMVLRGQKDEALVATDGIKTTQLFKSTKAAEPPGQEGAAGSLVQIIRRQKVENVNSLESFSKQALGKM